MKDSTTHLHAYIFVLSFSGGPFKIVFVHEFPVGNCGVFMFLYIFFDILSHFFSWWISQFCVCALFGIFRFLSSLSVFFAAIIDLCQHTFFKRSIHCSHLVQWRANFQLSYIVLNGNFHLFNTPSIHLCKKLKMYSVQLYSI